MRESMFATALSLLLVGTAAQCQWTECRGQWRDLLDCSIGYERTESKDCGTFMTQAMCCPAGCAWNDFGCNANALSDYFEETDDKLKSAWNGLNSNVQDKLTQAAKFSNLSVEELQSIGADLLAKVQSLGGMTVEQLKGIADKVRSFDTSQLRSFLKNVSPTALAESISDLVSNCSDADFSAKAELFRAKLEDPSVWGNESTWSVANVSALGCMLGSLTSEVLGALPDDSLAAAGNLKELVSTQLVGLRSKFLSMNSSNFKTLLEGLNKSELTASVKEWGKGKVDWGFAKAKEISKKLTESDAFGPIMNWSSKQISELGAILTFIPVEDLASMADEALASAANLVALSAAQLSGLSGKIGNMSSGMMTSLLQGIDAQQLHMAMLSQCEITCESEAEEEFLRNPTLDTASEAMAAYTRRVANKSAAAARALADGICKQSLQGSIDEARADMEAAVAACDGSAAKDNVVTRAAATVEQTFQSWGLSEKSVLLQRLGATGALGNLTSWGENQIIAMCGVMSAMTPGHMTQLVATNLVYSAATGGATEALPLLSLAAAALKWAPELRATMIAKLQGSMDKAHSWTCSQVAASRELVAGLEASELSGLSMDAIQGLLPSAVSAMSAGQVAGFTWDHLMNISTETRKRLSADRLSALNRTMLVAAICGSSPLGSSGCPPIAVDVVLELADMSGSTLKGVTSDLSSISGLREVQLLSALSDAELPTRALPSGRRLMSSTSEVTLRVKLDDANSDGDMTELSARVKQAAQQAASSRNGDVRSVTAMRLSEESSSSGSAVGVSSSHSFRFQIFAAMCLLLFHEFS